MPVINFNPPDPREPGRTTSGYAWAVEFTIGLWGMVPSGSAKAQIFATANAANDPTAESSIREVAATPADVAGFLAANPDVWMKIQAFLDGLIQRDLGGTVVAAPAPPEWATSPAV